MAYPSTISSLTDPQASDRLNNPSHSGLHQAENTAIEEVQTFIGTLSSAVGTLVYDIRAAASDGGGHVQTAVKGGTGQTTYTKGDLLVATGGSVLAKFAVGLDGQLLKANSSVAAGVQWAENSTPKIANSGSTMTLGAGTVAETSILSVVVPASTLGTNNAVRARLFVAGIGTGATTSIMLRANYGSGYVSSVVLLGDGNGAVAGGFKGTIDYTLIANNSRTSQMGILQVETYQDVKSFTSPSIFGVTTYSSGTASVLSDSNQTIGITVKFSDTNASNGVVLNGYTVEKIT